MTLSDLRTKAAAHPWIAALIAIALIGIFKGAYTLLADISRQAAAPLWGDSKLYMAGGQAMLNGINPYTELFESKPPFMFWLAALSLKLTGTQTLANFAQALAIMIIAVTPGILAWDKGHGTRDNTSMSPVTCHLSLLIGVLGGIAFAQYASTRSGYIQTESFGTAVAALYIATIWRPERMTWGRSFLATFFLFCATWLKEPFIVVLGACALVLMRHPRDLIKTIIVPGIVVTILSILGMWMLGYLDGYIHVYFPAMSGHHVYGNGSPWNRMWNVHKPFVDLWNFSPPLLIAVAALCIGAFLRSFRRTAFMTVIVTAIAVITASFVAGLAGQYYGHHFIFALPILLAVFIVWLRDGTDLSWNKTVTGIAIIGFTAGLVWLPTPASLWMKPFWHSPEERAFRATAAQFDILMDACKYDRYMAYGWELEDLWAHTTHSPYASTFSTFRWYLSHQHPQFAAQYSNELNATPIIVIFEERIPQIMQDTNGSLFSVFTRDIPPCAAPFLPLKDGSGAPYTMLFRM